MARTEWCNQRWYNDCQYPKCVCNTFPFNMLDIGSYKIYYKKDCFAWNEI